MGLHLRVPWVFFRSLGTVQALRCRLQHVASARERNGPSGLKPEFQRLRKKSVPLRGGCPRGPGLVLWQCTPSQAPGRPRAARRMPAHRQYAMFSTRCGIVATRTPERTQSEPLALQRPPWPQDTQWAQLDQACGPWAARGSLVRFRHHLIADRPCGFRPHRRVSWYQQGRYL